MSDKDFFFKFWWLNYANFFNYWQNTVFNVFYLNHQNDTINANIQKTVTIIFLEISTLIETDYENDVTRLI